MALSTAGAGSVLSAEQIQNIVSVPLQKASIFLSSGVQIIDAHGPVRIPTYTGSTSPSWHGENELIDEVEPTFDEVLLLDPKIKSVKSLHRFSNELSRQSIAETIGAIQNRMIDEVAGKIDDQLIAGTAGTPTGTLPLGLLNYTGVQNMAAVGVPTLDDLHDAEGLALGAEVDPTKLKWLMHSRDFVALRKIKQATGSNMYAVQPDPTEAGKYRLLGHEVIVSNRVPANLGTGTNESSIVLADFSKIAVARDMNPTVTLLSETFGDWDQQAIRVVARYDAAPVNPEAIVVLRGVKLTA